MPTQSFLFNACYMVPTLTSLLLYAYCTICQVYQDAARRKVWEQLPDAKRSDAKRWQSAYEPSIKIGDILLRTLLSVLPIVNIFMLCWVGYVIFEENFNVALVPRRDTKNMR